jgi:hypothetical protein
MPELCQMMRGYEPCTVEDGNQITSKILRHAVSVGLNDDEYERKEHAKKEEEHRHCEEEEWNFLQWGNKLHQFKGPWLWGNSRLDENIGDDEHAQDHER